MEFTISLTSSVVKSDALSKMVIDPPGSFHIPVDSLEEQSNGFVKIATGVTNEAINFGGVSVAKVVILKPDQNISIKLGVGVENNIASTAVPITKDKIFLLLGTEVSSILVTNASGNVVNLAYYLAG